MHKITNKSGIDLLIRIGHNNLALETGNSLESEDYEKIKEATIISFEGTNSKLVHNMARFLIERNIEMAFIFSLDKKLQEQARQVMQSVGDRL